MTDIKLFSNTFTEDELIDFTQWTLADQTEIDLHKLEASTDIINFVIRRFKWNGYRKTIDGIEQIGYNTTGDDTIGTGLSEANAYSKWLEDFKIKELKFQRLLAITSISQTQYDSLLALYYLSGQFITMGTAARMFDFTDWIKEKKWNYIATAMIKSGYNRELTQQLAKIMMFGQYGSEVSRDSLKEDGLNQLRKDYPLMTDKVARQQAEYVYYAETSRFLPNLTQTRKRQIVEKVKG